MNYVIAEVANFRQRLFRAFFCCNVVENKSISSGSWIRKSPPLSLRELPPLALRRWRRLALAKFLPLDGDGGVGVASTAI